MNRKVASPGFDVGAVAALTAQGGLFRKYVVLFVTVVSLALAINGVSDIWFSYQGQKALLFRIQRGEAQAAAEKISQFLNEVTAGLAWQTQLAWSDNTRDEWQLDAVRLLHQVPALAEIEQLDATGREQFRMSREAPDVIESGVDHSKDASFIQAMAHKVYYGPVYFIDESQPYMTIAMAGVRPEFGVVVGQVNLTFVWDVVSQIQVGKRGQAYVIDDAARLIAYPDISEVLRKTDMSRLAQVRAVRTAESNGSADQPLLGVDIKGRRVLSAHAEVTPPGWLVFTELPSDEAYAPLYDSALRSGILVLAALGLAFLAGLALARRMVVPIRALHDGAARVGAGELAYRISIETGDELEALGNQFNKMAARLQESHATLEGKVEERTRQLEAANLAKSRFLAAASHDLRQPLHAIGLFVGQLHDRRLRASGRSQIVRRIEAALSAMNDLFSALLDISKLDADGTTANIRDFPIAQLLAHAMTTFEEAAREKGLSFRVVHSSAWVRSDFILLERVIFNLISNALRYTERGGLVAGCRKRGDNLCIEVWDTGVGIPPDQHEKIFGEFYRLNEPDRDRRAGLGLGLAIVDRACRLLNHRVAIRSVPGKGSCFAVTVPIVPAQEKTSAPPIPARSQLDRSNGKLVLVIDNDPLVLEGMGGILRSWGCQVITVTTDSKAIEALTEQKQPLDLIISDYHLAGGKTGIEAIERLRGALSAQIPAFLISGDTTPEALREAKAKGCHLLHKPVDPMALRAMFGQAIKRPQILVMHTLAVGEGATPDIFTPLDLPGSSNRVH
jgi:signal transduction histidine kinase/ActR/RegA family two-component response regulator